MFECVYFYGTDVYVCGVGLCEKHTDKLVTIIRIIREVVGQRAYTIVTRTLIQFAGLRRTIRTKLWFIVFGTTVCNLEHETFARTS